MYISNYPTVSRKFPYIVLLLHVYDTVGIKLLLVISCNLVSAAQRIYVVHVKINTHLTIKDCHGLHAHSLLSYSMKKYHS